MPGLRLFHVATLDGLTRLAPNGGMALVTKSLSENTSRAKYGPCEGEVQEGEVVGGLLFPADE